MSASIDYCDLCDLPMSQCVHGLPPAPAPVKAAASPPKPRKRAAPPSKAAVADEPVRRRWTPPEAFKPLILVLLQEAGGALDADEAFTGLEKLAQDRLLPADSERTPGGELRWHYAARRARMALIEEGLMTKTSPGVWQLA